MKMTRNKYSAAFKAQAAIEAIREHETPGGLAKQEFISRGSGGEYYRVTYIN